MDWRDGKRLERLLKAAPLKVSLACLEDIDWRASRGLSREVIHALASGDWLRHGHNVLLTGATGCGKTWLACALGQQAPTWASWCFTCGRRACSKNSMWRMVMAVSGGDWVSWPSSIC